jgi:ketosteroid isomerase-like protein
MSDALDAATARDIRALEDGYQKAMVDVDAAWFERNWAPDLIYVHTSGRSDPRDSYVKFVRAGDHKHIRRETGDLRMRRYGDTVVVTGWQVSEISSQGEPAKPFESRFTRVYVRLDGRWICVSSQSGQNVFRG